MLRVTTYSTAGPGTSRIASAVTRKTVYAEVEGIPGTYTCDFLQPSRGRGFPEVAAYPDLGKVTVQSFHPDQNGNQLFVVHTLEDS
jgi:hypothetical protein